jgi:hypothetical protein
VRENVLPTLICIFVFVVIAFGFLSRALGIAGLILDILGALLLVWGEMTAPAAFLKLQTRMSAADANSFLVQIKRQPWYRRYPLLLAIKFGSADVMAVNQEPVIESFPKRFWAIVFLMLGFVLQAFASRQ